MFNNLIGKNKELGRFLFCERYTLQPVKDAMYIAEGQELKRGAVVDVNGVLVGTSSILPYAVLEFDCDTRDGGKQASVFIKGEFNFDKLHFASGLDKSDMDNIVYNGNSVGIVIKPYEYDEGFNPIMAPAGTSDDNPLMTAADTERMIDAMKPIDDMTLRFEFSKKDYNPETAGVGSAGTWTKVDSPTLNVWDWTNEETDWASAFQGAFPDADNEVRVIAAGDTSSVTKTNKMFAGNFTSYPQASGYKLNARNNIVSCVPFDVSNLTDMSAMFLGSSLREVVHFDFSNTASCMAGNLFSDTLIEEVGDMEFGVTKCISMFGACTKLKRAGIITFDSSKLVLDAGNQIALFSCYSQKLSSPIEEIGGIKGIGNCSDFTSLFSRLKKLKRINSPIDCSSASNLTTMFQNCESLEELPVLENVGNTNITSTYGMFYSCTKIKEFPVFDTSHVTDARNMFTNCHTMTEIPNYDFSSVTKVDSFCQGSENVSSGILETYNKFLDRGASITSHTSCFKDCGIDTKEGRAALAQIPQSWGGLAEG